MGINKTRDLALASMARDDPPASSTASSTAVGNISPNPHGRIYTKFCTAVEVMDVITCDKFLLQDVIYRAYISRLRYDSSGL